MQNEHYAPTSVVLDHDVTFSIRESGGTTIWVAHHAALGKFYQFGAEEYRVALLLDGMHEVSEIYDTIRGEGINWNAEDVARFVAQLVKCQLAIVRSEKQDSTSNSVIEDSQTIADLEYSEPDDQSDGTLLPDQADLSLAPPKTATPPAVADASPAQPATKASPLRFLSLVISQRIPLIRGDKVSTWLEARLGSLFDTAGMVAWCILVISGISVVYGHWDAFADQLGQMFNPNLWPMLILLWFVAKLVHETGHAVAAKHYGVRVGQVGIMFFLLAPLAYVDVTDAWRLRNRWHRVQIALGGVYFELALAALTAWAWWVLPEGYAKHLAAQFFLIAGPATLLVNANPLLRLDGYYVLADITEIPNLRLHGRRLLGSFLEEAFLQIPRGRSMLVGWRRPFAAFHALCSVLFQFIWMGGLILGVSVWAKGLGILLALAAALTWFVIPTLRWLWKIWFFEPGEQWGLNHYRRRLFVYAGVLTVFLQHFSTYPSPIEPRVPVVVRYQNEQIVRAASDAFVDAVYVSRGQYVETGTLLLKLRNRQLMTSRDQKADDLEISEFKAIQTRRQGQLALSATHSENAISLRRQLKEFDDQLSELIVYANRSGYVTGADIESLSGRFANQGDILMRVCDPREKELLVLVPEPKADAYQEGALTQTKSRVRLRGGTQFSATPEPLRPRALRSLPHQAFATTVGGPVPVEPTPSDANEFRMVDPHLESVTQLDPITSQEIQAGQLGTMAITDNRPLVTQVYQAICEDLRKLRQVR